MDNKAENAAGGGGWMGFAKNVFNRIVGNKEDKPVIEKKQQGKVEAVSKEQQKFVNEIFDKVTQMMRTCKKLTQQNQLTLYGLYKQATEGDNTRAKPNFYEMEASAKYSAWEKCKGMSKFEAKELYIKHANLYDESVGERLLSGEQTQHTEETKGKQESMSGHVPRPVASEEPTYDHPYIAAMNKNEPIKPEKELLLKMNGCPKILPIHYAIDNEKVQYVREFLKVLNKQDINLPDGQGMTTLEYAELIQNDEVTKLITEALK